MTVENNYVIAIATLSDWLKRVAPVFQPMWLWLWIVNCDWFIALFVPVVIGRSNCFGFGLIWKPLYYVLTNGVVVKTAWMTALNIIHLERDRCSRMRWPLGIGLWTCLFLQNLIRAKRKVFYFAQRRSSHGKEIPRTITSFADVYICS